MKESSEICDQAKKIIFSIKNRDDLSRDVFKSGTSRFAVPEIGLDMQPGTMGSLYTTVEGLLTKVRENLDKYNPYSGEDEDNEYNRFLYKISELTEG